MDEHSRPEIPPESTTGERATLRARVMKRADTSLSSTHRPLASAAATAEMQRQVMFQLVLGGLFFGAIAVGAAFVYLGGWGHQNLRAVLPTIESFMQAGASGSALGAHRLYSTRGIDATTLEDVTALMDQRSLFEGYRELTVKSVRFIPASRAQSGQDTAVVEAQVSYESASPANLLAQLEYENEIWLITLITLNRGGGP